MGEPIKLYSLRKIYLDYLMAKGFGYIPEKLVIGIHTVERVSFCNDAGAKVKLDDAGYIFDNKIGEELSYTKESSVFKMIKEGHLNIEYIQFDSDIDSERGYWIARYKSISVMSERIEHAVVQCFIKLKLGDNINI